MNQFMNGSWFNDHKDARYEPSNEQALSDLSREAGHASGLVVSAFVLWPRRATLSAESIRRARFPALRGRCKTCPRSGP